MWHVVIQCLLLLTCPTVMINEKGQQPQCEKVIVTKGSGSSGMVQMIIPPNQTSRPSVVV